MSEQEKQPKETFEEFTPLGARRCQAHSKRSGQQCGNPAITGKDKCRMHGGKSTGAPPEKLKGNTNRATPGSPRSKYMSVEQQRLMQEVVKDKTPDELLKLLMQNATVQSLDAMRKAIDPDWEEVKIVEKTGFHVPENGADPNGTTTTKEKRDYDKIAADRAATAARLASAWAAVKRVDESGDEEGEEDAGRSDKERTTKAFELLERARSDGDGGGDS